MWTLVVLSREGRKVVLEHRFYGTTKRECVHYLHSHMASDAFLRECIETGIFRTPDGRKVRCSVDSFWIKRTREGAEIITKHEAPIGAKRFSVQVKAR